MNKLEHFLHAQASVWPEVVRELGDGLKTSHWSWYVFPQLTGLGTSANSQRYAITDLEHARAYLAHPLLTSRLREVIRLVCSHRRLTAEDILGQDAGRFQSCLTLFAQAAPDDLLFPQALAQFYAGRPCTRTLRMLREAR